MKYSVWILGQQFKLCCLLGFLGDGCFVIIDWTLDQFTITFRLNFSLLNQLQKNCGMIGGCLTHLFSLSISLLFPKFVKKTFFFRIEKI